MSRESLKLGARGAFWAFLAALASCQSVPPPPGATSRFDGTYRGTRTLANGTCPGDPTPITMRVRGGHHQSGDRGLVFDIDNDGDVVSHGLMAASGHADGGKLKVYLTGTGSRACTYLFDMQRVSPEGSAVSGS